MPSRRRVTAHKVELVKAYSNPSDHVERLRRLLDLPRAARPKAAGRPSKQPQKRLDPDEVDHLVAAHLAGVGVKKLAVVFGIHRDTVHHILKRKGALRRRGVCPEDLPEAIRLYEDGWSLARLAVRFDVSAAWQPPGGVCASTLRRVTAHTGVTQSEAPPRSLGS